MTHPGETFPCPRCGERLPAGFTRCDACGAYLVSAPASVRPGSGGPGGGPRAGGARAAGGHGGATGPAHASAVTTTAWVFLALGLACGGVIGYSLHSSIGPRGMGGAPKGPSDIMAAAGGAGSGMSGGGMGGAPTSGGMPAGAAMPAEVMAQVQQYKATLTKDPNDVEANIGFGNLLFDSGQWGKAVDHYQTALEKDPKNADVRVDMAIALHNLGQDPKAVQELERATRDAPSHKNAWLNLGVIAAASGDRKTAINAWERYLALDPNGPHAASIREQLQHLKSGA